MGYGLGGMDAWLVIDGLDLSTFTAFMCGLAALGTLYFMQRVTGESDLISWLGRLRFAHRVSLGFLVLVLAANCYFTIATEQNPRPIDVLTLLALFAVLALSCGRHMMVTSNPGKEAHVAAVVAAATDAAMKQPAPGQAHMMPPPATPPRNAAS